MPMTPLGDVAALRQHLGAPGEKWPQREDEHLIEIGGVAGGGLPASGNAIDSRRFGVPRGD